MEKPFPFAEKIIVISYLLEKSIPEIHIAYFTIYAERKQDPNSSKGGETMKIRKFREAAGLTMTELAGKVGVSVATVSRWESGEDLPAAGRLPLLSIIHISEPTRLMRIEV